MRFLIVALSVLCVSPDGDAGFRNRRVVSSCSTTTVATTTSTCSSGVASVPPTTTVTTAVTTTTTSALDLVNSQRAARGLRPFIHDPLLTAGAEACAAHRARLGLFGHTNNDFGFLPPGASASAAGCAAYPAHYGFMACCTYEGYTYAGAAQVVGADGKVYNHLFVR